MKVNYPLLILLLLLGSVFHSEAKVHKIDITSRQRILGGRSFGDRGAYEILRGTIHYQIDPANPYNQNITDIQWAQKNANGLVEARGDLVVIQAVDPARRSGLALVEVSNRGGKFSPGYFNRAGKSGELDPNDPDYWGDGLLMRQGMTVIWVGWQFDVPEEEHALNIQIPSAQNPDGSPIEGWVRSDWTVDAPTRFLRLGHRTQVSYPAIRLNSEEHTLTVRDGRDAPRRLVPRTQWQFAREENGRLIPSEEYITIAGDFQAGKIYELAYRSAHPPVAGLGLAAIRDVISYAKYDPNCPFPVRQGLAAGVSQTGRFLRHFLYQGFNTDEAGRQAYDGLMIITAGAGRGSFNHRFAQPSRDAHRYSAFFYPTDIFPFTGSEQTDPLTGKTDGLLQHLQFAKHLPKIFYINTGYEYWGRAASLIHTTIDGQADVLPGPNERIYHLAGGQHYVDRFLPDQPLPGAQTGAFRGNPLEIKVNYRALLLQLAAWVQKGQAPPESRFPKISEQTLVDKEALKFPAVPGVAKPTVIHNAYRADYGPRWAEGIVDRQPPQLGYSFPSLVAQVDSLGNELGGVKNVEIRVPLATYTPWSLRTGAGANEHELMDFRGSIIPLPRNRAEAMYKNDPRPSLDSLYRDQTDYLNQVEAAAKTLTRAGFLLEEDISYVKDRAAQLWDWTHTFDRYPHQTKGPEKGSLLIIGGGRLDSLFYGKFMELAGGPDAPVVIIPTAGITDESLAEALMTGQRAQFEQQGFQNVTVLHTADRSEADSKSFTKALEEARGVWFTGGRQWRLVDAYAGTRTEKLLHEVLARGGVIAGSSAGATIQGSYLARGDTRTNVIMMGDHEEGFGFVSNIAIDQHLLARNRQFDLHEILDEHPHLLGIGLDENTGILVQGNTFEVMGESYIAVFDHHLRTPDGRDLHSQKPGERKFYLLRPGERYDMWERRVLERE